MRPRRPRIGDYLVVDDESGFTHVKSDIVRRWDGALVRKDQWETRNPQEFVKARKDPAPLKEVRPAVEVSAYCPAPFTVLSNGTFLYHYTGPGKSMEPGIAVSAADPKGMSVDCTLYVYPD